MHSSIVRAMRSLVRVQPVASPFTLFIRRYNPDMSPAKPEALMTIAVKEGEDTLKYIVAALYPHDGTDTRETIGLADLVAMAKALQ